MPASSSSPIAARPSRPGQDRASVFANSAYCPDRDFPRIEAAMAKPLYEQLAGVPVCARCADSVLGTLTAPRAEFAAEMCAKKVDVSDTRRDRNVRRPGIRLRRETERLLVLSGLLSIGFGIILVGQPDTGAPTFGWVIGWFATLGGCINVSLALQLATE